MDSCSRWLKLRLQRTVRESPDVPFHVVTHPSDVTEDLAFSGFGINQGPGIVQPGAFGGSVQGAKG